MWAGTADEQASKREGREVKKLYATPRLRSHGDIREVTRGEASGLSFDASYLVNFVVGDPTTNIFS
jgi:hypothetical protein